MLRQYETPAGNVERTMSGQGYRSNDSYYDIATTQPMVEDADGDLVSEPVKLSLRDDRTLGQVQ